MTTLSDLVNPEVMADMISAKLPNAIKFSPLAKIDTTLVGVPGDTITVPTFAYIGDASDVAEGVAAVPAVLTASTTTATVKKAVKAVDITDEAVLSGYGDPVGEAEKQLLMSVASKIDADCLTALGSATLISDQSLVGIISYDGIVDAIDLFQEEDYSNKVLFVHPSQVSQLRKDADFKSIDQYPLQTVMTGIIGSIAGCQVRPSNRIDNVGKYTNYIVKIENDENETKALTVYMKKDVSVETDRDILAKNTTIAADEHYTAVLSDASKVVEVLFKLA